MPYRVTLLCQLTTAPTQRADASPHTGGWSESFWRAGAVALSDSVVQDLLTRRARLMPTEASIVGVRIGNYNISANKLVPVGSSTGKVERPGYPGLSCDYPGIGLSFAGSSAGVPNASRFAIRGMPDEEIRNGEYTPDSTYKGAVTQFCNTLTNGWGFIGRDLSVASQKVMSIAGNVVTLAGLIGAVVPGDNMILNRVTDDDDDPVKGSYYITNVNPVTFAYTLSGFPATTLTSAKGTARVDRIAFFAFSAVSPSRAVGRKVGRPFASYRGRASKKTA